MNARETLHSKNARLIKVFDNLLDTLRNFIRENHVTHEEYRHAVAFLGEVGQKGEASLLCDVFVEVSVDEIDNDGRAGTITTIEGPFYVPNVPALKSPCVLPQRPNEHGPVLFFPVLYAPRMAYRYQERPWIYGNPTLTDAIRISIFLK